MYHVWLWSIVDGCQVGGLVESTPNMELALVFFHCSDYQHGRIVCAGKEIMYR